MMNCTTVSAAAATAEEGKQTPRISHSSITPPKTSAKTAPKQNTKRNPSNRKKPNNAAILSVPFPENELIHPTENFFQKQEKQEKQEKLEENQHNNNILRHLGGYIEEPYQIIESYFHSQHLERLVRHQIESYNHFTNFQIPRTIQMFNPVIIRSENDFIEERGQYFLETHIQFDNFKLYPPQIHENNGATKNMLPQEARLRNFTYASTMTVDINIEYVVRNTEKMDTPKIIKKTLSKINIGKMPIMVKSALCILTQNKHIEPHIMGECSMDCGGYFIIKGSEKTVLGQERAAENKIYCFDSKNTTKWTWFAEIKSVPDYKCISPKHIEMMISSKDNGFGFGIYISIPRIKQPIELFVLFRALGVIPDKEICKYILLNLTGKNNEIMLEKLQASIVLASKYLTQEAALKHITAFVAYTPMNMDRETGMRKKREFALDVLSNDLFPHCRTQPQKLYMIGYMANKLLQTSLGWLPTDDRDSYVNKRIDLTGTLLNNLFRNYFNKLVKELQKQVVGVINTGSWRSTEDFGNIINMTNIYKLMKSTTIENGINRALSTGDFSIKQSNSSKVGVAQVLNRLTYLASLSHLRRINTPLEKSGELVAPRKLHSTTWGYLCLAGDVDILLSNRIDTKKIKDMHDGNWVNTVNRETLLDEPSPIHHCFGKMPDKLYEITTISGRKIKATPEHPFLVRSDNNKYEMKTVQKMIDEGCKDKLVIRHTVIPIADENRTVVIIRDDDVLEQYRTELLEKKLLNHPLPIWKLKIIARLLGVLNTTGNIDTTGNVEKEYYSSSFYLGEKQDMEQVINDIVDLGFECSNPETGKITMYKTWKVSKDGAFAYFMFLLGGRGLPGKKSKCVPEWLMNAELSIKREFLSGLQGGDGSELFYNKTNCGLGSTTQTTNNEVLDETIHYTEQIITMFKEFNIQCKLSLTDVKNKNKTFIHIIFECSTENLNTYADTINYIYCEEKRRNSAKVIEHLKIDKFTNKQHKSKFIFDEFIKDNIVNNGCISVPILSVEEVKPEMVYDFTTHSENHSFIASGFVSSNCSVESPEGASIGIVKNLSYMAHITIPSNSMSLYEYVSPYIHSLDTIQPDEMFSKVKVFVNGCILGYTDTPVELYKDMKSKKYGGIINIYTSIVFDCKLLEIRICNDGGRLTRPVLRVDNDDEDPTKQRVIIDHTIIQKLNERKLCWNDLLTNCKLDKSVIEYIDPEEQNFTMIAMIGKNGLIHDPPANYSKSAAASGFINEETADDAATATPITSASSTTAEISSIIREEEKSTAIKALDASVITNYKYKYTHCEIHPSTIFGILASCIPFPEHNQSPRNTYQTAMQKQAIGIYATNFEHRMDKTSYILAYPSKPLVETRLMNFIHLNKIPSGAQIHVAIMTHTGYNQEDSVLINQGSIDRGLFSATIYHTEKDEDKNIIRDEIVRCKPDKSKTKGIKFGNYDKLNSQGFIPENTFVENRDIIIAKIVPIKENRNDHTKTIKYEDQSKTFRTMEETYIDKNYTGRNGDGYNFAKVRVRTFRKPVLGDKFAARSAQKGTLGNIIPEADMPFTKDGMRPDLILNPHAIPSRMTIAQLKETLLGKVLIELGLFGDSTSFNNLSVYKIAQELQNLGYESYGNEIMYDGLSGEQMETSVFIGPTYYQRLKHMVNDKTHSRSIGPMVNLTRQPAEGRSRDGGFRVGEMERDVLLAHGMAAFTRERLYDVSDKYSAFVCKKCGFFVSYNDGNTKPASGRPVNDFTIHLCKNCNNMTEFSKVEIPYSYKLLSQELQTINVATRIITE